MLRYAFKRLLLMIPTLLGILLINFTIIQFAPGGPIEQMIAKAKGQSVDATERITAGDGFDVDPDLHSKIKASTNISGKYAGSYGIDPEFIKELEIQYGFDKPAHERFFKMVKNFLTFEFGDSFFQDRSVISLIAERLPVSISLGLWTTLLTYLISIPLGIRKAVQDGTHFDIWTSTVIIIGYAIPSFLFAIMLIIFFAGGSFWDFFPIRDIVSENWHELSWPKKILDYFWHMTLPITAMVISGFASLTLLTKNSFLEEINKQYVTTARAKGLSEKRVLYGHIFRNAMLIIISGFPSAFIHILFTSSLLIEVIFSLNGLGLLGFEATLNRDYPIIFSTLYIYTLVGLLLHLISDLTYMIIDPRINFERKD